MLQYQVCTCRNLLNQEQIGTAQVFFLDNLNSTEMKEVFELLNNQARIYELQPAHASLAGALILN